jgi:hypothetical protein
MAHPLPGVSPRAIAYHPFGVKHDTRNHFLWFGHLGGSIMGVFCLARRLFLLFHLCIFFRHMGTSEGVIPTSEGCIPTKQANFGPYFARTNTLQTQNSRQSAFFAQKTPCFGNVFGFCSYPTDIPTRRTGFGCIWIMDLGSKIQR